MRMIKMEFVVFSHYLRQMPLTLLFVMLALTVSVGNMSMLPGVSFLISIYSLSASASVYDENNNWEAFRLALPITRAQVVLGRYAFMLLVPMLAAICSAALIAVLVVLASTVPVPSAIAKIASVTVDGVQASMFTFACLVAMGVTLISICTPVFFKLGHTKTTQWLPLIMVCLGVVPLLVVQLAGKEVAGTLVDALAIVDTPEGLAGALTGIAVFCIACYAASIFASLRVYASRDL